VLVSKAGGVYASVAPADLARAGVTGIHALGLVCGTPSGSRAGKHKFFGLVASSLKDRLLLPEDSRPPIVGLALTLDTPYVDISGGYTSDCPLVGESGVWEYDPHNECIRCLQEGNVDMRRLC